MASPARGPVSRRGEDTARPGLSAALKPVGRPHVGRGGPAAGLPARNRGSRTRAKVTGLVGDRGVWGDGRSVSGSGGAGLRVWGAEHPAF